MKEYVRYLYIYTEKHTCKKIQSPVLTPLAISFSAIGPCPWPRDMACIFSEYPFSLANLRKAPIGSEPVLSTKTSGTVFVMSRYKVGKSVGGFSTNILPRLSLTKSVSANTTFSSWKALMKMSFWKLVSRLFQCPLTVSSSLISVPSLGSCGSGP